MTGAADWRAGYRSLEARVRGLPALLRAGVPRLPALSIPRDARRCVVTGVGSSAAHARFLARVLADAGVDARAVPVSALVSPPDAAAGDDVLIVVSQGLSPNARLALAHAASWRHVVLLTAATGTGDAAKRDLLAALPNAGMTVCPFPAGENEYETLVRVVGPMAGYACALHVAAAIAPAAVPAWDVERVCAALDTAPLRCDDLLRDIDVARFADGVAFLTSGTYAELVDNLRYKVVEGMLLPAPPVWDVLEVAHGPLQQAHAGSTTFLALTRADAPSVEGDLLASVQRALDPDRHVLLRLHALLPGPLAIFEHEALMNELLLRFVAARRIDQIRWPGRERDRELYDVGATVARPPPRPRAATVALETLTWPEVDALLAAGVRAAVIPLGSTEQHGPHLPFATDTWIADAVAARLCARLGDAIRCPTLPLGCAAEHLGFPGTLHVTPATLHAVLTDVLRSLAGHGFARAFIFSAHGGNYAALEEVRPALRAVAAPMRVSVFTDLAAVSALFHRVGAELGVDRGVSGHHAGEFETSVMRAIRAATVRTDRLEPGLVAAVDDAQKLFYPSLRPNAPRGVIGDPRPASAARAGRYLDAWVDLLADAYRRDNPSA